MAMVLPRVSDILFSTVSVADNRVAYPSILYATYPRPRHILVHLHAADPAVWYFMQQYVHSVLQIRRYGLSCYVRYMQNICRNGIPCYTQHILHGIFPLHFRKQSISCYINVIYHRHGNVSCLIVCYISIGMVYPVTLHSTVNIRRQGISSHFPCHISICRVYPAHYKLRIRRHGVSCYKTFMLHVRMYWLFQGMFPTAAICAVVRLFVSFLCNCY
jgi:hypothetical protein